MKKLVICGIPTKLLLGFQFFSFFDEKIKKKTWKFENHIVIWWGLRKFSFFVIFGLLFFKKKMKKLVICGIPTKFLLGFQIFSFFDEKIKKTWNFENHIVIW